MPLGFNDFNGGGFLSGISNAELPDAYTPPDGDWNVTGDITVSGEVNAATAVWDTSAETDLFVAGDTDGAVTARTGGTLRAPDATTGGAGNIAGADLTIRPGIGTGTGDVGQIIFKTVSVAAAGDNLQSVNGTDALVIDDGLITVGADLTVTSQICAGGGTPATEHQIEGYASGVGSSEWGIILESGTSNAECILNFGDARTNPARYAGRIAYRHSDNSLRIWTNGNERIVIDSSGGITLPNAINHDGSTAGFYGVAPAAQPTSAADLTNNVTSGGTNDQVDNWTDLSTYATDAAAIRNAIYQLARKLKQVNDGLRDIGLLS